MWFKTDTETDLFLNPLKFEFEIQIEEYVITGASAAPVELLPEC